MNSPATDGIALVGIERNRIRSLKGFRQGHRVPQEKSPATDSFVGRIAEPELQRDLETRFGLLKEVFAFKRRDISKSGPTAGQGSLTTPLFAYEVSIGVDADRPADYRLQRRVAGIADLDSVSDGRFDSIFRSLVQRVQIPATKPVDVERVIDAIEDADPANLTLDYNSEATVCRVRPRGQAAEIVVTSEGLVVNATALEPSELLWTAIEFRQSFAATFEESIPAINSGVRRKR